MIEINPTMIDLNPVHVVYTGQERIFIHECCSLFFYAKRAVRGDCVGGSQLRVMLQSLQWEPQPVYSTIH